MQSSGRPPAQSAAIDPDPVAAERARLETQEAVSAVGARVSLARQAGMVAHDLGNLVGVVRGATALIAAGVGDRGLWASCIETAMDGATALMEQLRAQADPAPDLRPTDLRGPVGAAADLARARLRNVDLRLDLPPWPVVVAADAAAVGRVVLDLALALAAGPAGDGAPIVVSLSDRGLWLARPDAAMAGLDLPDADLLARAGCEAARDAAGFRLIWPSAAAHGLEAAE